MSDTFNIDSLPFGFLTEDEKTLLLSQIQRKKYQPLDVLLHAGETSQGLFVISEGRVAESESSAEPKEQVI